jgi:hypothetical protein
MEGKKKFEKPELHVVEMKRNLLGNTPSTCDTVWCCGCDFDE